MEKCVDVSTKEIEFYYDETKERYIAQIEISNIHDNKSVLSKMYISSFVRYTVKPSVLAIQPKQKRSITIILNKEIPIQEAKTDKFKLISLSFDEDVTTLSYNEQKEKFKSLNHKENRYSIDLTSIYKEKAFTPKCEEKPKEENLPKETVTTIRIEQAPMNGLFNMKSALIVFFVSIFISYYLVNKYI